MGPSFIGQFQSAHNSLAWYHGWSLRRTTLRVLTLVSSLVTATNAFFSRLHLSFQSPLEKCDFGHFIGRSVHRFLANSLSNALGPRLNKQNPKKHTYWLPGYYIRLLFSVYKKLYPVNSGPLPMTNPSHSSNAQVTSGLNHSMTALQTATNFNVGHYSAASSRLIPSSLLNTTGHHRNPSRIDTKNLHVKGKSKVSWKPHSRTIAWHDSPWFCFCTLTILTNCWQASIAGTFAWHGVSRTAPPGCPTVSINVL